MYLFYKKMLTPFLSRCIVFPMIKVETENLAVPIKEKQAFARYCKENGIKIYVAAAQALAEWLQKRKAGK